MAQFLTSERFGSGADGAYSTSGSLTDSSRSGFSNTTITGTLGGTSATAGAVGNFAANDLVLIHQSNGTGVGQWELNKISSIGGGTNWTMAYTLTYTYVAGAQVYRLLQYSSVTIGNGHTLTGTAWGGSNGGIVAFLCNGTTTITGTITLNEKGHTGSAAQNNGVAAASGDGPGGGGGGNGGAVPGHAGGGGGGYGVNGTAGTAQANGVGGSAGASNGTASLVTMNLGSGGGGGSADDSTSGWTGSGGTGGGLALIISKTITVTGNIYNNGGAAGADSQGGGGSGGGVLLKGQTITLGSNLITATAGSGDSGGSYTGGNGAVGRIHADYSTSISGTTNPTLDSTLDASLADPSGGGMSFMYA